MTYYKPACLQCGKQAKHLGRRPPSNDPAYGPWFCSRRCAADWALERAGGNQAWCGVRFEDDPNGDCIGPHGWHEESACPECEALAERTDDDLK